jgi:glycosyltransferase involved in cell wall biosynthesis
VDDAHLVLPLLTLGDPQRLTGGYLYHLRMAEAAPRHGARIVFASFPDRPFPAPALAAPRLLGRVGRLRPAALLIDSIVTAVAAPSLAVRPPPVPVVGVLHQPPGGIDHGGLRRSVQAPLDRLAHRRAAVLLAASEHLADQLAGRGVARERIRVVPPGRDVASPPREPPADLRRGRRAAFLSVGNWVRRKGLLELLDAFATLPPGLATLHLAGEEESEAAYARRVRARLATPDLAGRVVRHGPLSREGVAALYAAADVFVLPAFREPYGTVWGEAMAFGLPVVGWRAENLPYLARDGEEAVMVEPGDVRGLARALEALAGDEALRRRIGAAARARAAARPTWEESAALFFGAIREVVAGSRQHRSRGGTRCW